MSVVVSLLSVVVLMILLLMYTVRGLVIVSPIRICKTDSPLSSLAGACQDHTFTHLPFAKRLECSLEGEHRLEFECSLEGECSQEVKCSLEGECSLKVECLRVVSRSR